MSDEFLVRKGEAVPAATHPGDAARFHARRTIVLPAINLHITATQADATNARALARPPRTARLTGAPTTRKKKFTFRVDPARHTAFCRAAEMQNVSRQRLLTEALDVLLRRLGHMPDAVPTPSKETTRATFEPSSGALLPDNAAALRPPL